MSATLTVFCVAMLAMPFVLDYRRRARKGAQLLRALERAAKQQQGRVHRHERCGDIALGLDRERKVLYFHSQREGAEGTQHVLLSRMRHCQAVKNTRGAKDEARVDRVELTFTPKDKAEGLTRFVLYQAQPGTFLDGEIQLAEEWAGLVNDLLD